MQLPLVWMACISTVARSASMSGTSSSFGPVVLDVLPRGEVAVVAVVLARQVRQHAQLPRGQQAVGNRNAQHGRMPLDVQAVAQAQGPELVFRQLARKETPRLVAELGHALVYERLIELIVLIHGHGL